MRESSDFRSTMRHGVRSGNTALVVHLDVARSRSPQDTGPGGHSDTLAVNPPAAPALVGFAVSKAVGGAVVRNRVKRRLRHLMAARIDRLPAGSRMVVRALPASALASSTELAEALEDAWARSARRARPTRAGGVAAGTKE